MWLHGPATASLHEADRTLSESRKSVTGSVSRPSFRSSAWRSQDPLRSFRQVG